MIKMDPRDLHCLVKEMAQELTGKMVQEKLAAIKKDHDAVIAHRDWFIDQQEKRIEELEKSKDVVILEQLKAVYRAGKEWCENWPSHPSAKPATKLYQAIKNCPDVDQI